MNKKGFTVVELITSFALTMVITVFLFEVLIDIKDIYVETAIKTSIQQKLSVISKNIKRAVSLRGTTISCSDTYNCKVNNAIDIKLNTDKVVVGYQEYTFPDGVQISNRNLTQECTTGTQNCYLKVNLELQHPNLSTKYKYETIFFYYDYTQPIT
ncbi:MAG: hypothetical protein IKG27_01210 [Bacilli bacterium]|nr:hypothetical protein [Bacilli bacterium]